MRRVRLRVSGRVQGVFFRDSVRGEAAARGVAGWVRNCPDGTVEAVFEGPPDAIDELIELCGRGPGPGHADVAQVEVAEEDAEGLDGFEVR